MPPAPPAAARDHHQRAKLSLRIGRRSRVTIGVSVTSGGLLAVGALTSSVLLSTAVLVRTAVLSAATARRAAGALPPPRPPRLPSG